MAEQILAERFEEFQLTCKNTHKSNDEKLDKILKKLDDMNEIAVLNGGGKHVTYNREEFFQWSHDLNKLVEVHLQEMGERKDALKQAVKDEMKADADLITHIKTEIKSDADLRQHIKDELIRDTKKRVKKGWVVFAGFVGFIFLALQIIVLIKDFAK